MPQSLSTQLSQETQSVVEAAATLTAQTFNSVDDAITAALDVISRFMRSRTLVLSRFDTITPETRVLNVLNVRQSDSGSPVQRGVSVPAEQAYCNTIWNTREPLMVEDARNHPFYSRLEATQALNIGSYVGVPLLYSDGTVYGTLCGLDPEPLEMQANPELIDLLQIMARLLISYIERDELNAELTRQRDLAHDLFQRAEDARIESETANALRRKVTGIVAHELHGPLVAMKQTAVDLVQGCVTDPRTALTSMIEEFGRLVALIEQVVDITRIENGLFNIRPDIESVRAIVDRLRAQLETAAHRHTLEIDIPSALPPVWADRERIAEVLLTLVSNSALYAPERSSIGIRVVVSGDEVQIEVCDCSPGIPQGKVDMLFYAFRHFETQSLDRVDIVGLGLSVARGIIDAHGGRMWVVERGTPGTTIAFTLMIAQTD